MTEQSNLVWLMKKLSLQLDSGTTLAQALGAREAGLAGAGPGLGQEGRAACAWRGSKGVCLIRTLGVELNSAPQSTQTFES